MHRVVPVYYRSVDLVKLPYFRDHALVRPYFNLFCHYTSSRMATQLQAREYLVLGDSNVKRFYTKIGLSLAQNLDFVQARNVAEVSSALSSFKRSYRFVVMAFWSNLIVDAGETASNDVDRMTAIDEMFNSIVPLIRCCF